MKKIIGIVASIILITSFLDSELVKSIIDQPENKTKEAVNINNNVDIKNFYNIKIGDSELSVISNIGNPARKDISEYGFYWYVYNQFKNNFAMVGIKDKKVVALYSNSIDSLEMMDIKLENDINYVRDNYKPIEYKRKGNTRFIIDSKNEFDILKVDDKYITIFYDLHTNNQITSYQVISENIEDSTKDIYPVYSKEIQAGFEKQIIDLANSVRDRYGLKRLVFCEKASSSSLKHSKDMGEKNYFDHNNIDNESPFDRMKKEDINYSLAGENIAAGQINAIYAHEAWMNSLGHRKNILGDYDNIGVGVSFGGHYKIYYTQNFYSE